MEQRRTVGAAWFKVVCVSAFAAVACLVLNTYSDLGDAPEPVPVYLVQSSAETNVRIVDPEGINGPLEAISLAHEDAIPTLHLSKINLKDLKAKDLKQIKENGASLRAALQGIIKGLTGKRGADAKNGDEQPGSPAARGRGRVKKLQKLDYSDAVLDQHHNEPYDKNFEEKEWSAIAREFRDAHPNMSPKQEQKEIDAIWRQRHPWYYHAYGPTPLHKRPASPATPSPHPTLPAPASPGTEPSKPPPPLVYPDYVVKPVRSSGDDVPPTVLAPPDDGIRDFDGAFAVQAHLPPLGHGRTKLDDHQMEVRGSFAVRVFGAFGQPELEVTRMWGDVVHPFTCTYRGYRKLTGDFQGNVVMTGFKRVFHSAGDPGRILTGMDIPPSGNPKEFDIMTCRDNFSGEVQYFKLHPEYVLARMRERYCAGNIPSGHIGACAW